MPLIRTAAFSKAFAKYRKLDLPASGQHIGKFQFVEGRDAADHYLVDMLLHDPTVHRSSDIVVASGDTIFMPAVKWLRHRGHRVHLYVRASASSCVALENFTTVNWAPELTCI